MSGRSLYGHYKEFNFVKGINRAFARLALPDGFLYDALNVLPTIPGGVQIVQANRDAGSAPASCNDLFFYYPPGSSTPQIITRATGASVYANGAAIATAAASGGRHSMFLYKGSLAICEQGHEIVLWNGTTSEILTNSPCGGLGAEYAGRLCNIGDPGMAGYVPATKFPTIRIPVVGTGTPLTVTANDIIEGEGSITVADTLAVIHIDGSIPSTGANCYVGKILVLAGIGAFSIQASNHVVGVCTEITIRRINNLPVETTSDVGFTIFVNFDPLELYPKKTDPAWEVDLGCAFLGTDTSTVTFRVKNRSSTIPVRVVDIRAKGKDFRISENPQLPATIPPGGSLAFKVTGNAFSYGDVKGSVIVEHDMAALSSLTANLTMTGIRGAVMASPTVVDFGEWVVGEASPDIAVAIKNPIKESIYLTVVDVASPFASTDKPAADEEVEAEQEDAWKVKFTPASGVTSSSTFSCTRKIAAHQSRMWISEVDQANVWDFDFGYVNFDEGDAFSGEPEALANYDDALIVFKEATIYALMQGGEFGFRKSEMTLGKGVGAMNQQAVAMGNGSLWAVTKAGIYRLTGSQVDRLDELIPDLISSVAEASYNDIRAFFCNDFLFVSITGSSLDVPDCTWVYSDVYKSWWRLSGTFGSGAVRRGQDEAPAAYITTGGKLYELFAASTGTTSWSMTSGFYAMDTPSVTKFCERVMVYANRADLVSGFYLLTDGGDKVYCRHAPLGTETWIYAAGVATWSGAVGVDSDANYQNDELNGKACYVEGSAYSVLDTTAPGTIQLNSAPAAGRREYYIASANAADAQAWDYLFKEAFGGAFQVYLSGTRPSGAIGNLFGFVMHLVPMGEPVGQPGQL